MAVNGTRVFAATTKSGVFASSVNSANWASKNNGLPTLEITSLGVTGQYVLAGYRGGIHATSDYGVSWQAPNVELFIPTYANVSHFAFSDTRIFITAPYNSFYSNAKTELPPLSVTSVDYGLNNVLAKNIRLTPNPSYGQIKIELSNELKDAQVVKVYSNQGVLIDVIPVMGADSIDRSYPKGIYFIQADFKGAMVSAKLIIE
jgi:hypothetical protein